MLISYEFNEWVVGMGETSPTIYYNYTYLFYDKYIRLNVSSNKCVCLDGVIVFSLSIHNVDSLLECHVEHEHSTIWFHCH